ncbi:MAG: hypothetical protein ABH878_07540 [bacterium]
MSDIPLEIRFRVLCEITRAQHFAWRQAVVEMCPDLDATQVVNKMWKITGHETAKAYLKRLDSSKPLPMQLAASIVWSSVCMGEEAHVEPGRDEQEAFVVHNACPWFLWHQRLNLLPEDQPGCDIWFETAVLDIREQLGIDVRIETLSSLPEKGDVCKRRIWVEK